jgi:hypothetical protein
VPTRVADRVQHLREGLDPVAEELELVAIDDAAVQRASVLFGQDIGHTGPFEQPDEKRAPGGLFTEASLESSELAWLAHVGPNVKQAGA